MASRQPISWALFFFYLLLVSTQFITTHKTLKSKGLSKRWLSSSWKTAHLTTSLLAQVDPTRHQQPEQEQIEPDFCLTTRLGLSPGLKR
ncbi:hypothetical protein ACFX13_030333 [Malus domestica]